MLKAENLRAEINGKKILKGVDLCIRPGEIHVLMGPNGSGKSTLASAFMGRADIVITGGRMVLDGKDIKGLSPSERARLGLFLAFQYPVEVPGVSISNFLRTAYRSTSGKSISPVKFRKILKEKAGKLGIPDSFIERSLNEGFSGGEKKKNEILQMAVLEPKYSILDETDSGLDVTSLKTVAEGICKIKNEKSGILVITHYTRILKYLKPDYVHVMIDGKIIKSDGASLAGEIEESGYGALLKNGKN